MGQRGPAPLPRAIKQARGTLQPCGDNHLEPEPPPVTNLSPPDHLGEIARTKYIQLAETLSEIGVLKVTDLDVLACYCQAYEEVRELTEEVKKAPKVIEYGTGNRKIHPNVVLLREANKQLLLLARELGLTPSARTRIEVQPDEKSHDELLA